jgi:hypothetical protein
MREYHPNQRKLTQLVVSGFVASLGLVALNRLMEGLSLPFLDFGALYGAILSGDSLTVSPTAWWGGMLWHFLNGCIVFPILYDFLIEERFIPNRPWVKGVVLGVGAWLFFECVLKPLSGAGVFSRQTLFPPGAVLTSLLSGVVYGLLLERMTRVRIVHALYERERNAA